MVCVYRRRWYLRTVWHDAEPTNMRWVPRYPLLLQRVPGRSLPRASSCLTPSAPACHSGLRHALDWQALQRLPGRRLLRSSSCLLLSTPACHRTVMPLTGMCHVLLSQVWWCAVLIIPAHLASMPPALTPLACAPWIGKCMAARSRLARASLPCPRPSTAFMIGRTMFAGRKVCR